MGGPMTRMTQRTTYQENKNKEEVLDTILFLISRRLMSFRSCKNTVQSNIFLPFSPSFDLLLGNKLCLLHSFPILFVHILCIKKAKSFSFSISIYVCVARVQNRWIAKARFCHNSIAIPKILGQFQNIWGDSAIYPTDYEWLQIKYVNILGMCWYFDCANVA